MQENSEELAFPDERTIHLDQLPYDPATVLETGKLVEITQSSIAEFLACQQKFVFRYILRLKPKRIAIALIVGGALHKGMEIMLEPGEADFDQKMSNALSAVDNHFAKVIERSDLLQPSDMNTLEHGRAQAHALLRSWFVIFADDLEEWQMAHSEMKVRASKNARIGGPMLDRAAGMIDGILFDKDGRAWILEHKTRSRLDNLNIFGLDLDHQALWYMILCLHVISERAEEYGSVIGKDGKPVMPEGFLYNAMQKPQHRLNSDGFEDLKSRMYDAILADPGKYMSMTPVFLNGTVIEWAKKNFERIVRDMDSLSQGNITMNLKACDQYDGCPYRTLCAAGADTNDPISVLSMPEVNQFEIAPLHEELAPDGAE